MPETIAPSPHQAAPGQLYEQGTSAPTRKLTASTVATAASGLVITGPMVLALWNWAFPLYPMTIEVALGIVGIVTLIPTLFTFVAGYFRAERKAPVAPAVGSDGARGVGSMLGLLLAVGVLALLTACATVRPVQTAETVEQKAYAAYGLFVVAEETAADIVELPATPDSVVAAIATADALAKPLADSLAVAARAYTAVRLDTERVEAMHLTPGAELLAYAGTALRRLEQVYADAAPAIEAFVAAVDDVTEED